MFYNALIRKDKGEGVEEKDVAVSLSPFLLSVPKNLHLADNSCNPQQHE